MVGFRSISMRLCSTFALSSCASTLPAGPADVAIARVDGELMPRADFRDWLIGAHGWRHVDDYLDLTLLRRAAAARAISLPTPAELEAAFEQDWQDQILLRHGGAEAGWLAELQQAGIDRAGYRDRRAGLLELEVIAKRLLKQEPMRAEQARELWEREFGPDGMRTHVQVAFFSQLRSIRPGQRVETAEMASLAEEARGRAQSFLAAVRDEPGAFAKLVRSESDPCSVPRFDSYPIDLRARGGDLPRLRADHFGGALTAAVKEAKSGDLLGPITTASGFWVVHVLERTPRPFDDAADELAAIWRDRDPSAGEVVRLRTELRGKAKIERYPLNR